MDRLTLAIASGQGIAMGGEKAYSAWLRSRMNRSASPDRRQDAQNAALQRMAAWRGPGGVSPVRIREH